MVAMLGKTLYYLELHIALSLSAIYTNHRLRRKIMARAARPPSLLVLSEELDNLTRFEVAIRNASLFY